MLSTRVWGLACAVAVFVCLVAASASAQPLDKRSLFTFIEPITLPGITLPAGRYLFRLADPDFRLADPDPAPRRFIGQAERVANEDESLAAEGGGKR